MASSMLEAGPLWRTLVGELDGVSGEGTDPRIVAELATSAAAPALNLMKSRLDTLRGVFSES